MLTIASVLAAVDDYADLIRAFTASATNARRLGGMEAPSNIISVFVGDKLWSLMNEVGTKFTLGKDTLPDFPHATDRNRTSPFAFTGNKFELRMVGSSATLADINTALNTVVADSIMNVANRLKAADDVWAEANKIVAEIVAKHGKVVYNGNNYDAAWKQIAAKRGLPNLDDIGALMKITDDKNIGVFARNDVMNDVEVTARRDVAVQTFVAAMQIEAATAREMYTKQIAPDAVSYLNELVKLAARKASINMDNTREIAICNELDALLASADAVAAKLAEAEKLNAETIDPSVVEAVRKVIADIDELRLYADKIEAILPDEYITYPTYTDMLFAR